MKPLPSLAVGLLFAWVLPECRGQELPQEKLQALFADAASFRLSKKPLPAARRAEVESALGAPLAEEDLQRSYYLAMKAEGGAAGVVYLGRAGEIEFGVSVRADGGAIGAVKVFAPADSPLAAETFLKQFEGRTVSLLKPPAEEEKALVEFLRAQFENMAEMDAPQQSIVRKLKAVRFEPLSDEPAALEKGSARYVEALARHAAADLDIEKLKPLALETAAAAKRFAAEAAAAGGDAENINAAYKILDASCEKCHGDYMSAYKKKRQDLVPPRGASDFVVGKDLTAPAGQESAVQALAGEIKKVVALAKANYGLK